VTTPDDPLQKRHEHNEGAGEKRTPRNRCVEQPPRLEEKSNAKRHTKHHAVPQKAAILPEPGERLPPHNDRCHRCESKTYRYQRDRVAPLERTFDEQKRPCPQKRYPN
jgi:hypothetical protein